MTQNIIHVAEDNDYLRDLHQSFLGVALGDYGFEMEPSASGEEVQGKLEAVLSGESQKPILVLLDNNMAPGPSGIDLISKYSSEIDCPFILVSATDLTEQDVKDAGGYGLLRKPFIMNDYSSLVRKALGIK